MGLLCGSLGTSKQLCNEWLCSPHQIHMVDDLKMNYNKTSSQKVNIVTCFHIMGAWVNTLPRAALTLLIKGTIL